MTIILLTNHTYKTLEIDFKIVCGPCRNYGTMNYQYESTVVDGEFEEPENVTWYYNV